MKEELSKMETWEVDRGREKEVAGSYARNFRVIR